VSADACASAARPARAAAALALLLVVALIAGGCAWRGPATWGEGARIEGFDPDTLNPGGPADFTVLLPLSAIFYERITARRFNSLATYEDPALREFFRSESSFSDYYAAFAEALDLAHFESLRPTHVRLDSIERIASNAVRIEVTFRGENGLPLRWWSTFVTRRDQWEFAQGRWWVVPGKL
jgi:hypothetical protein